MEPADVDFMLLTDNDTSMWEYSRRIAPLSRDLMLSYASTYDSDPLRAGQLRLIIEDIGSKTPVGILDIYNIDIVDRFAYIGIVVSEENRHKGFALRALHLAEHYCHHALGLNNLAANVSASNHVSQRLFEKAGFHKCGCLISWLTASPHNQDMLIYQLQLKQTAQS